MESWGRSSYHRLRPPAKVKAWQTVSKEIIRLPELVIYDHIGFSGAYARTNLSFHYHRRFLERPDQLPHRGQRRLALLSRRILQGPDHWDLGPGYYESFFTETGPDDVVSSFQAIALT